MKEMLKTQMVKLSKLEIWYYQDYNFMTGIRATLSNGARSPIFRTAGEQSGPIVMHIEQTKRAKTLGIRSREDGVYGLRINDRHMKSIVDWSGDVT